MYQDTDVDLCDCMDDRVHHTRCEICLVEVEVCDRCGRSKTEHCLEVVNDEY